ncbi:MAG: efflux RND transporter periplasmic adaptor subunit [Burkholderiales bacterium]|nr:efflux RND transporter periplasmic adaptor subunit [Burkholderiales bacterium]
MKLLHRPGQRPGLRPALTGLWLAAAFAAFAASTASAAPDAGAADPAPSVQIETVPLAQQALVERVSGYGVIAPDAASLETLSLPRAGQVLRLRVRAGERVQRGQTLLEFGNSADADLAWRQAEQALAYAGDEAKRVAALVAQQLATRSQLAAAQKALADAEAAVRAQQRIGADRPRQALQAPYDGVVMAVPVAQGDRLAPGAPLLQLARNGPQRVLLGLEPGDARTVRPGMAVQLRSVIDSSEGVRGRVSRVFGMINPQTQLVDVQVDVPASGLLAGSRVSAQIEIGRSSGWVVPRSAVLRDAQGAYLFQVVQGKARRVAVTTGLEQGGLEAVQAAAGARLDPAQPVVSLGNYELQDGMAVRGAPK